MMPTKAVPTPIADLRKGDMIRADADGTGPVEMVWGTSMVRRTWGDGRFIKWEVRVGDTRYCNGYRTFTERDAIVWKEG